MVLIFILFLPAQIAMYLFYFLYACFVFLFTLRWPSWRIIPAEGGLVIGFVGGLIGWILIISGLIALVIHFCFNYRVVHV